MPNPHINPNPSPKAQALSKGRKWPNPEDPGGPQVDEAQLIRELAPQDYILKDIRVQGNKVQKRCVTAVLHGHTIGQHIEPYIEWIDA
jgi:hypothetical protein